MGEVVGVTERVGVPEGVKEIQEVLVGNAVIVPLEELVGRDVREREVENVPDTVQVCWVVLVRVTE